MHRSRCSLLWPFFRYTRTESIERYDLPWPFIQVSKGEDEKKLALFPFYWRYDSGKDNVLYVMWPFYKHSERVADDKRWYEQRWLLINRYLEEDQDRFLNVWPFFEYRSKKEESTVYVPSVLPFRNERFDRIVRPLLTLYTYKSRGDTRLTNLLYGLYTKEETGDNWRQRFAFLFELKKEPEGYGFEVLSGLFGVDARTVKVLFISIRRENGDRQ